MPRWKVVDEEYEYDNFKSGIYESDYKGLQIARCNQNGSYPAQATLLAAAPELYEALKKAHKVLLAASSGFAPIEDVDAALADARKALGYARPAI